MNNTYIITLQYNTWLGYWRKCISRDKKTQRQRPNYLKLGFIYYNITFYKNIGKKSNKSTI